MPFGINNREEIVGWYGDSEGTTHGFLKIGNAFRTIDYPNADESACTGINERGAIVGSYGLGTGVHGFVEWNGVFTRIDYPGLNYTEPFGINNQGALVGFYWDGIMTHGFLYENGSFKTLDVPGALATQAYAINEKGQIAGGYVDSAGDQGGFLYDHGMFTRVSSWYGINNKGETAGVFYSEHPGPVGALPLGINNRNQVVGAFYPTRSNLELRGERLRLFERPWSRPRR